MIIGNKIHIGSRRKVILGSNLNHEYIEFSLPNDGSTAFTLTSPVSMWENPFFVRTASSVLLADDLTENATLATWTNQQYPVGAILDGSAGQVMTKINKLWYKEGFDESGNLNFLGVANYARQGYTLHPKFSYGSGRDYIYVGGYEASNSAGNVLQSISGAAVVVSQTLATFRTRAAARGAGWYQYDFWTNHLLHLLFYAYYLDYNSQVKLPGYTNRSSWADAARRATGRSNLLISHAGSVDYDPTGLDSDLGTEGWSSTERKIANRFLWVENLYGHIWKFNDGCSADGRTASTNKFYATPDPAKFSSSEANVLAYYDDLGVLLPGTSNETYIRNLQSSLLPFAQGGDGSTYITDYYWSYLDDAARDYLRIVLSGSRLSYGVRAGVAARISHYALSHANALIGSRLCAAP